MALRVAKSGRRRSTAADPDSPDANTSTEEENNDCKFELFEDLTFLFYQAITTHSNANSMTV